jgi:putative transcriptional regulator
MGTIYIDSEQVLREKGVSKNRLCIHCSLQRMQLNNYCKNKVGRVDLTILGRICEYLKCTPNDILKMKED